MRLFSRHSVIIAAIAGGGFPFTVKIRHDSIAV